MSDSDPGPPGELIQLDATKAAGPAGGGRAGVWALLGQLLGLGLVCGLAFLQAGADLVRLFDHADFLLWAALAAWILGQVLVGLSAWRSWNTRPLVPLLVGLAPLVLAFVLSAMSTGNLAFLGGLDNPCASFLSVYHGAERVRLLGLMGCAASWLGVLPLLLRRPPPAASAVPGWLWPATAVALIATAVWTFTDPLLPDRSAVGGFAVRGLWALAGAVPVLMLWIQSLRRPGSALGVERGLALWTVVWAGWLLCACAVWLLHREDALLRLSYPRPGAPLVWPEWFESGLVLGASVLRLAPLAAVCLVGSLYMHRPPPGRARRRAVGLAAALLALALLGLAHERGFADGFASACLARAPAGAPEGHDCAGERRVFGVCLSASLALPVPDGGR